MAHSRESDQFVNPVVNTHGTMIRVYLLGPLTVQWIDEAGKTFPFPKERLYGRGAAPALSLLKALLSQPHRFALRDWLMEQFWPATPRSKAEERLDDVASGLRTLLRPPESTAKILYYVHGGKGSSGSGYRLEGYPQIWVDADALNWYVDHAALMDRFGQDSLSLWETAYRLATRGIFLPEEVYSDWAKNRRETLDGHCRQCVHRLAALLRAQGATEQAILRLRTYWQEHLADEDALRPLLEMLGELERYQEAELYYTQACEALEQEERAPDHRTLDMIEYVRTRRIQRERTVTSSAPVIKNATPVLLGQEPGSNDLPPHFSQVLTQDIIGEEAKQQSGTQDMDPSRRDLLQTLAILGTGLFTARPTQEYGSFIGNHSLDLSKSVANLATITQQFRAMQRRGNAFITNGVNTHIQTIHEALEQAVDDGIRRELWRVLAQTQIVAGFNPIKKTERGRAKTFLEAAIASAQNSGDTLLTAAALGHLAQFSLREEQNITKALQLLTRAQECVQLSHPLSGWFALVMASITAKAGYTQQCEAYLTNAMTIAHHLPQAPEYADIYFTDFSLLSVHIFTVNCWLVTGNATKAYAHLTEINLEELSDNRRASAFYDASRACAMMGEFEMAQQSAFRAIDKALSTQQLYVIPRCMTLAQAIQQKEPDKSYASAITDYARLALQQN